MITIATHRYNGALHNTTNNNTNNHTNERTHITTPSSSSSLLCEGGGCDHIFLCESICEYVCVFFVFCYIKPCFCIVFHVYMCKYLNHLNMQQNSCLFIFFEDVFFFSICYFLLSLKKRVLYKNKLLCLKPHPPPFCVLTQSDSDSDCCPLLNLC